jgi:hypothetical protein
MRPSPLYLCPQCHPGPIGYAGPIVSRLCGACRARNDNDRDQQQREYERVRSAPRGAE